MFTTVTSPFLLITLFKCLGIEDTNCWSFASGIFAQSRLAKDSCSTVCGHRCLMLLFMMGHTFSITERSGLQAGKSSTSLLWSRVSRNHSVVACAEWDLALSCFPWNMSSWWQCLCTIPIHTSTSMVPSHIWKSPWCTPIPWQMFAFAPVTDESV